MTLEASDLPSLYQERRQNFLDLDNPTTKQLYQEYLQLAEALESGVLTKEQFAHQATIKTEETALVDTQLNILNAQGLKKELELAVEMAKRFEVALSVLYLDGDQFKRINDQLGHHQGDQVIAAMAAAIKASIHRKSDIPAHAPPFSAEQAGRQGGDEFAVILLGTDLAGAEIVAERIRQAIIEEVDIKIPEHLATFGEHFSVTVGAAQFDPHLDHNPLDLLKRADQNMLKVKRQRGQDKR